MNTSGNTILITGGASGIGLATAKLFAGKSNRIIIVGRNKDKLIKATEEIAGAKFIVCDITDEESVNKLAEEIQHEFPELNILMNNAGKATLHSVIGEGKAFQHAKDEMDTNFLSAVRLTEKLLPLLSKQSRAAIINNSSVSAFIPAFRLPAYSASKAALHSYTQSLRYVLQQSSNVKVFEVIPPLVDTEFSKELKGEKIAAGQVAAAIVDGLGNDVYEIHVAGAAQLYKLFYASPEQAFKVLNGVQ